MLLLILSELDIQIFSLLQFFPWYKCKCMIQMKIKKILYNYREQQNVDSYIIIKNNREFYGKINKACDVIKRNKCYKNIHCWILITQNILNS